MAKERQLKLFTRENKNYTVFFTKLYIPTTKEKRGNTYQVNLGRETEVFDEIEAMKKLKYLQKEIDKGNYNYKDILLAYEVRDINVKQNGDLTLEEVAQKYFNDYVENIRHKFFFQYRFRFDFETIDDIEENQTFKNKMKSARSYMNYFKNYVLVEEWDLVQEYTQRTKKPKKKLTKKGIKKKTVLSQILVKNITSSMADDWVQKMKKKTDISEKTKYNIVAQLRTIFNYAFENEYIDESPFVRISSKRMQKNPKNVRQRILKKEEVHLMFDKLYERSESAFLGSLMGFVTGARLETILNIKKEDFQLDYDRENFIPCYYTVKLFNFKTDKNYEVPLPEFVGYYLYILLKKDYEDDDYLIRAKDVKRRQKKSLAELPKDFKLICDRYLNATEQMKVYYEYIEEDLEHLQIFKDNSHIQDFTEEIEAYSSRIEENQEQLVKLRKEYLSMKNHKDYLEKNVSFHTFRHSLSSQMALINPFVATKFLNHSADKLPMAQQTLEYSKTDIKIMKKTLEEALKEFLSFMDKIVEEVKIKNNYTTDKEEIHNWNVRKSTEKFEAEQKAKIDVKSNSYEVTNNAISKFEIISDDTLSDLEKMDKLRELENDY